MELLRNQAALILGLSETGEITVDVAAAEMDSLPGSICQAIALKLMQDEEFQAEIMDMVADRSSSA
ncbi:MAG TPA: twitching motility protein [Thermodesulfobacteriaceae bacterium]|nr:twitching motility protein [Thermodesulfobacteriaceae bacterium]